MRAVELTPEWHTKRATYLNNLGIVYQLRFQNQTHQADSSQAIEYLNQAVALTQDGHSDKASWLNNLGNAYSGRFFVYKQPEDFNSAERALSQAASLTSKGHVNMSKILISLAILHNSQFEKSGLQETLNKSISYLQQSIECARYPAQTFNAARFLAKLLSSNQRPGSLPVYQIAMDCLPQVIWLGEVAKMRITQTFQLSDLVQEAAAAAIVAQETDLALEWLEQGRSIIWGQFLQLRAPLDGLTSVNPALAAELKLAADELDNTSAGIIPSRTFEPESYIKPLDWNIQRLHQVANQYEKLLDQVRQTPGFENFLRPKKASELVKAAQSGPVVVINVHKSRCDALIMFPNETDIVHVPLPNLYEKPALKLHVPFEVVPGSSEPSDELDGFRGVRSKVTKNQYESMLEELWECVAKPVLEALAISIEQPPQELTHITWNTTGPLSLLPLHAAGDYTKPHMRLFEFAISSYTPMLGILLRASPSPQIHSRILAVGQETTPGQALLPGTKIELESIKALAKDPIQYMQLDDRSATVSAVLGAMEEYDWVHLACHAYQLPNGPLGSSFRLHEGNLELMQILQKRLRNRGLAFLSACHTAAGEERFSNESAHLASGMLIAGYSSVIATMWTIADDDAPLVAERVYSQLIKGGKLDYTQSARALHMAIGELRAKIGEKSFARWVPFIHIGL
ncbi:Toll-like receptor 8 [Rhizoctonia solani]|uniref:Toll-like receptor 8 n=1 Tax=Rhizoctonia solani TaxID=456999 RepID=A0A0K6GGS5_9AGAM|nr:Toll-like receptor 8 [Rhizoctonia solani]